MRQPSEAKKAFAMNPDGVGNVSLQYSHSRSLLWLSVGIEDDVRRP